MMASRERQQTPGEPTMSELDSLVVSFQTQLSDVMEAVLKSAMFQVSRLVEDVFLLEVKRRSQEADSLRMRLQWTETKLSEEGGKCVDCGRGAVELSMEDVEKSTDQQEDILGVSGVKTEVDAEETWMLNCRKDESDSPEEDEEHPASIHIDERESQLSENEDALPVVDMKEEGLGKPSCSVLVGRWDASLDDEQEPEMDKSPEMEEAESRQTQDSNDSLLMNVINQDLQTRSVFGFSEEQQEKTSESVEMNSGWAGLTVPTCGLQQNQTKGAQKHALHEAPDSVLIGSDRDPTSSGSPAAGRPHGDVSGVLVKEEVLIDSDGSEENEDVESEKLPGTASFLVRQHRLSSETRKSMYHRAAMQEVMKLHSKVGAGLRLQAALQHLHRPMKKHPHTLSTGSPAALSAAQTINPQGRVPSTSKAAPPPSLAVQRAQTSQLHRAGAPWISIKAQHQSAHAALHPDSPASTRHLLRCGQCGKCFPHPSNLKAHLQTHTGERPFCCSLCGRSFTKLSNLKAHRRVHTGERPYCCLACGKRFTQKCNLKRHQRIHLDV